MLRQYSNVITGASFAKIKRNIKVKGDGKRRMRQWGMRMGQVIRDRGVRDPKIYGSNVRMYLAILWAVGVPRLFALKWRQFNL